MNPRPLNRDAAGDVPYLMLGTASVFSQATLAALLQAGRPPAALLIADPGPAAANALTTLARAARIPTDVIPAGDVARVIQQARGMRALVVACWPCRLPPAVLDATPWGALNVHPSRLPHFRGPAPLFWQLRAGVPGLHATVHRMSDRLDQGPILAQATTTRPGGWAEAALDRALGTLGGGLVARTLEALVEGRAAPRPQPPGGSRQGWPGAADFVVPTDWPLQRAWDFMRGSAAWSQPFCMHVGESRLLTGPPTQMRPGSVVGAGWQWGDEGIEVSFAGGTLLFDPAGLRVRPA